jgi:hypothetical protein
LGYTPENSANKSTDLAADAASNIKYSTPKSIVDYFNAHLPTTISTASLNFDWLAGGTGNQNLSWKIRAGTVVLGDGWTGDCVIHNCNGITITDANGVSLHAGSGSTVSMFDEAGEEVSLSSTNGVRILSAADTLIKSGGTTTFQDGDALAHLKVDGVRGLQFPQLTTCAAISTDGNGTATCNDLSDKADTSHTHAASDITSGTVAQARGGTALDTSSSTGIPYISAGTWAASTGFKFDGSNLSVNLGSVAAPTKFVIGDTSSSTPRGLMSWQASNDTASAHLHMRKSRGTFAAPLTIVTGDVLGRVVFAGYEGSAYNESAYIRGVSTGTIGSTRLPSKLEFYTSTNAAPSVATLALTIDESQNLTVAGLLKAGSTPTTLTDSAGKILSAALNTVAIAQGGTGQTAKAAGFRRPSAPTRRSAM